MVGIRESGAGSVSSRAWRRPGLSARAARRALRRTAGGQLADRPSGQGTSVIAAAVRGVEALAQSLALELRPIRVNVVAPGFVDTPLYDAFGPQARDAILGGAASSLPGGRVGRADEVGEAIAFLLGNRFMNAEILHIDGGGRLV